MHRLILSLASRSSSRPTSRTVSARRTLRRSTRTRTPPSVRTPPSSPPRRRRTGRRRALSTRFTALHLPSARSASRRRSRPSRPTVAPRRPRRRRKTRSKRLALHLLLSFRGLLLCVFVYRFALLYDFKRQAMSYAIARCIPILTRESYRGSVLDGVRDPIISYLPFLDAAGGFERRRRFTK